MFTSYRNQLTGFYMVGTSLKYIKPDRYNTEKLSNGFTLDLQSVKKLLEKIDILGKDAGPIPTVNIIRYWYFFTYFASGYQPDPPHPTPPPP